MKNIMCHGRRKTWLKRIKIKCTKPTKLLVCELHFTSDDVISNDKRKRLVRNAFPSLNLPPEDEPCASTEGPNVNKEIQVPEMKLEPEDEDEPLIDMFTEEETVVTRKRTLPDTEPYATLPDGIPLKRERSAEPEEITATDQGIARPLSTPDVRSSERTSFLDLFIHLGQKYLSPQLAKFIEVQALMKRKLKAASEDKNCNKDVLLFALKLYHSFPQSFKLMQEALYLPSMLKIKQLCRNLTWEINDTWSKVIQARFELASAEQRECVVCVAKVSIQLGLSYDPVRDRMLGLDEIDGVQRPRTARYATVVYARGLFTRWQQPLSYALVAPNTRPDELWIWLDIVISKLFDVGLNMRALITDFDDDFVPITRPLPPDKTYFQVKDKQIYCFYDCTRLMVKLRDSFMAHNINFKGLMASWEVIEELYEYDSTRRYKLAKVLTAQHVRPAGAAALRPDLAVQALSPGVAAALAAAVDLRVLDDSAHGTVQLITTFSTLYDVLHAKELAVVGNKISPEIKFLNDMLVNLDRITFMDEAMRVVVVPGVLRAFRADVRAALALQERMRRAGRRSLPLRAFNNDPVHRFFDRVRDGAVKPTARQLVNGFRRSFVFHATKSFSVPEGKLDGFLEAASGIRDVAVEATEETKMSLAKGLVPASHFAPLLRPRVTSPTARYMLDECSRLHPCCEVGLGFCRSAHTPEAFVDYLGVMERKFRKYFSTECLEEGVLSTLLASLPDDEFPAPCSCFPVLYLKTFYLRFRIANLAQFNNNKYKQNASRYFTMNILHH